MPVARPQTDIEFTNIMMKAGTTRKLFYQIKYVHKSFELLAVIVDFFATWLAF
jgi:hypothetical protein